MARVRPAVRCSANRTNGQPCRGYAIVGGNVCRAHGGAAPQVRDAANRRVLHAQLAAGLVAGQAKVTRSGDPLDGYDFRFGPRRYRAPA
jgi:hypothetical protein